MTALFGDQSGVNKKSSFRLSLLRVIAALGIVLLHTANISEILYREEIGRAEDGLDRKSVV